MFLSHERLQVVRPKNGRTPNREKPSTVKCQAAGKSERVSMYYIISSWPGVLLFIKIYYLYASGIVVCILHFPSHIL